MDGTATGLALAAAALAPGGAARVAALAGALLYGVGSVGVTLAANLPLNNRLAQAGGDGTWPEYLRRWTRWNGVRTVASLAASLLLGLSAAL